MGNLHPALKSFYRIVGFSPGKKPLHKYEFGMRITDMEVAAKMYDTLLDKTAMDTFDGVGRKLVKQIFPYAKSIETPYHFVANPEGKPTWLLWYCQVPGNATDLGIEGTQLSGILNEGLENSLTLEYGSHNTNSIEAAYGLLSLWARWADVAAAIVL